MDFKPVKSKKTCPHRTGSHININNSVLSLRGLIGGYVVDQNKGHQ